MLITAAVLIGLAIGWLLRGVKAVRDIERLELPSTDPYAGKYEIKPLPDENGKMRAEIFIWQRDPETYEFVKERVGIYSKDRKYRAWTGGVYGHYADYYYTQAEFAGFVKSYIDGDRKIRSIT